MVNGRSTKRDKANLGKSLKRAATGVSVYRTRVVVTRARECRVRRPHPYFGRLNRREQPRKLGPGQRNACEPLIKPKDEPGILWAAFRERPEQT